MFTVAARPPDGGRLGWIPSACGVNDPVSYDGRRMGEPVSVIEKASGRHGLVRFDTNRSFTGMGHERYYRGDEILGDRPPDVVARLLFETGKVDEVHVYQQTVTVKLASGANTDGLAELLGDLYIHYKPGVPIPTEADFS